MAPSRIIVSLLLLAAASALFEALAFRQDTQRFPRPVHLVDAGALRLNLHCTGHGKPTVILEAGLADSLDSWSRVQPGIARLARVCSYDRAGYGYSDAGPMPRTSERIASELHSALASAGEKPPFLMVGHSYGGYNVRVFNGKYPDEVAAILLVDSTQEDQYRLLPPAWAAMGAAARLRARKQAFWAPLAIGLGFTRLQLRIQGRTVPPVILQSKYLRARASEFENIEVSAEQARAAGHLRQKPLLVLTAGKPIDASLRAALNAEDQKAYEQTWIQELQPRLTRLSSLGKQIIVPDSGHDIPSERPDAIIAGVRELMQFVAPAVPAMPTSPPHVRIPTRLRNPNSFAIGVTVKSRAFAPCASDATRSANASPASLSKKRCTYSGARTSHWLRNPAGATAPLPGTVLPWWPYVAIIASWRPAYAN